MTGPRKSLIFLTIFAIVLSSIHYGNALRILCIFVINGKSHFSMQEQIMIGLAKKGHQVDVYSHFPQKKPIPNYTDFSLVGTVPSVINNMTYELVSSVSSSDMKQFMSMVAIPGCELLSHPLFQKLLKDPPKYDLVFTEVFACSCHLAWARYLKVPLIGVTPTPLMLEWVNSHMGNPINLAAEVPLFSKAVVPLTFFERVENVLSTTYRIAEAEYYMGMFQNGYIQKYFGPDFPNAVDIQKDISLLLLNYNPAITSITSFTPAVVPVGGAHIQDSADPLPQEVQKWLDDSTGGCIYVSFGSMVRIETFPKSVILGMYETFKKIAPVRVLMKIAKKEELPSGLPSNVMTQPWLSQIEVLKHKNVKAFVTHGGLLGTQESIYFGKPLVGIPLFGDQTYNLNMYQEKKVAIKIDLKELSESKLTNALNEVLFNPIYKKNAEKVSKKFRDTPLSPVDTSVFWIEYIARHGKDALRSPLVDMPWWQANLLDVYAFILAVTIIVLYIFVKIVKFLMCCVCSSRKSEVHNSKKKKN